MDLDSFSSDLGLSLVSISGEILARSVALRFSPDGAPLERMGEKQVENVL